MNRLSEAFERNKKQLFFALAATFFWGLLAHAYCFFDNSFSHDSLNELHGAIVGNNIKLGSGRIFVPIYRDLLRSDVTLPWLIGALSLIWIGLAVFLVLRIFRVESKLTAFLTAGIFSVNITVSATAATYIHDLDCNMFALLCAVGAVYLWKEKKHGWLAGAVLLMVSMGIYQSFLFTAVTLVMMDCILRLLDGKGFQEVFSKGLKAIGMILLGGIGYYFAMKRMLYFSGIQLTSGDYNSLDLMLELTPSLFGQLAAQAYADWFRRLMEAYTSYPGILVKGATAVLLAVCVGALSAGLLSKKLGWKEKLLLAALTALLPLGMHMIYILTLGGCHDLMVYSIWLTWLLALLLSQWLCRQYRDKLVQWQRWLCSLLVVLLLYGSVQFANGMYLKKDLEYDAYLSMMTRVVDKMEDRDGYIPGETPVVFVGMPKVLNQIMPGFKDYWNVSGMISSDVIYMPEQSRYQAYFDYVLGVPLVQAPWLTARQVEQSEFVSAMPTYPAEGCMQLYEGMLVVKFSDAE